MKDDMVSSGVFTSWPNRPWPPFGEKYVFLTYKKLRKLGMAPPFVKALTGLRRLPPVRSERTSPTTAPLEVTEPCRLPPSKSQVTEPRQLPPLEVTEPRRLPPP